MAQPKGECHELVEFDPGEIPGFPKISRNIEGPIWFEVVSAVVQPTLVRPLCEAMGRMIISDAA